MKKITPGLLFGFAALALLLSAPPTPGAGSPNLALARQLNEAFVEVADKVSPSVVVITVTEKRAAAQDDSEANPQDLPPREFWRRFHRQFEDVPEEETHGQGSGIILRADGYILTNRHVVENADTIEVRLKDGRTFKATVRGLDPQSDVAVIKIDAHDLPIATMADSSKTRVGEFAIAIGAPFSLDYTVTYGHVSAKGRSNVVPNFEGGAMMDQDFIQTDANINPGNSGGPLVNIEGEVIGINTLIRGLHTGIGFAIPSSLAREVADQLIAEGKFRRAWLGVSILSLRDYAEFRDLVKGVGDGVVVRAVLPNGPASKSDLKATDIITAVDGRPVATAQDLRNEIRRKKIGQAVMLEVFRIGVFPAGKSIKLAVNPGEWVEERTPRVARRDSSKQSESTGLGVTVRALTPDLAEKFGVEMTEGVIVTSVDRAGAAARNGIKPGDVITSINHQAIRNPRQFQEALKQADLKKGVIVTLLSDDTSRFEVLKEGGE